MRPMLASAGSPPKGADWCYEVKWDGMRVLAEVSDGRLRLYSRTGRDVSTSFPELARLGDALPDAMLDGEIITLLDGQPSFAALSDRMHVSDARRAAELSEQHPVTVMAFDLLRLYGVDLLSRPLSERRATMDKVALPERWQLSPIYADGVTLFAATQEQGLEGMVSKRISSSYQPGRRSADWVKTAHRLHQSCVVGGWRPETGSADRVGSLLIGIHDDAGSLQFCGRVGSGLAGRLGAVLAPDLLRLACTESPFAQVLPRLDAAGARYLVPELVVEVRHLGWTSGGRLRQPAIRGMRTDVDNAQVRRES